MICDFGDVAVVSFPFVDSDAAKVRPALAISNKRFNAENGSTLFAMITTAKHSAWPSDISIKDHPAAGLVHPSVVRWKLFTLDNGLLRRIAGRLAAEDIENITRGLRSILP